MSRASTPMRSAIASAIAVDTPKPPFAALPPSPGGYGGQVGTRSRGCTRLRAPACWLALLRRGGALLRRAQAGNRGFPLAVPRTPPFAPFLKMYRLGEPSGGHHDSGT